MPRAYLHGNLQCKLGGRLSDHSTRQELVALPNFGEMCTFILTITRIRLPFIVRLLTAVLFILIACQAGAALSSVILGVLEGPR